MFEGEFEMDDLMLDVMDVVSNPWNISPTTSAIPPFLEDNDKLTLWLFTPGPQVPLMFIKLGFVYGQYFQLVQQPGFREFGGIAGLPISEGLKVGRLNLVAQFGEEFVRYEGKWSRSAIVAFIDQEVPKHYPKQEL